MRTEGDWEGWLDDSLDGVATIADEAVSSARELFGIVLDDRERILEHAGTSVAALRLFELLPSHPIVSVSYTIHSLGVSKPTAARAVDLLETAGILVETTGKKRDRSWAYQRYLERLRIGTELESLEQR